ncbi:MAG: TonB-dependent receptor [Gammaproteobacteria bacterium]|nr:TonB-dependent receptor [Gammaproteobacteria bacterium]
MSVSRADFDPSSQWMRSLAVAALVLGGSAPAVSSELAEVIVTAQKREQSLQDVPIFVSVVSGDQLDAANIMNFSELSKLTPGVSIDGPIDGLGSSIRIRGIGVTKNIEGIRPSLGIFVDDIPLARVDNAFTNFSDIDRIEVLKGPQATLFGKKVSSGAIVIHTKKPHTGKVDGNLELNVGNFGLREFRGAINLPMGAVTAARLSGYSTDRDSEIQNVVTGRRGETSTWGVRLQVLRKMTDNIEAIATLEHHEAQVRSMVREKAAYGRYSLAFATANGVTLLPIDVFDRKVQTDGGDGRSHKITNASLRVSWDINEVWSLTSLTAYQKFDRYSNESDRPRGVNYTSNDLFGTFSYLGLVDDEVLTQELRLAYNSGPLSSIAGIFYEDAKLYSLTDILVKPSPTIRAPVEAYGDRTSKSYAVFLHNIYKITDHWTLTAGVRYSDIQKGDRIDNLSNVGAFGTAPRPVVPLQDDTWTAWSGTAKISYRISDELTVYGGYDRGFKAGGHNISSSGRPDFDDETVDNYEAGIKGLLFGRRLRWSASVFDQKFKNFQVNSPSTTGATSYYQNAASVDISGIETEVTWMVSDRLTLDATLAYVDSKFGDFKYAECTDQQKSVRPACTQDLSGRRVNGNSPFTGNLSAQYEAPLTNTKLKWFVRGDIAYRDEMEGSSNLDPRTLQGAYTLVNGSIGLSDAAGAWNVSLWGKNLTDKDYVAAYEVARDGLFGLNADLGDSRSYGVNVKYRF